MLLLEESVLGEVTAIGMSATTKNKLKDDSQGCSCRQNGSVRAATSHTLPTQQLGAERSRCRHARHCVPWCTPPPWHLSHLQAKEMGGFSDNVPSHVRREQSHHMLAEGPMNSNKIPYLADHLPSEGPAIGFIFQ